ncbi:MAG: polysaccharide biosynthesis protein [Clostridia bacterium]|nr:polysaccharide biosynthesis protein [Clostridia bacterium]
MNTVSKRQFLGGAAALTVSTVLVKFIGLAYKIPLMHCLGAEGMGYFNSAYEIYTLFFVIATAGVPVAISIMVSENIALGRLKNAQKIYRTSLCVLISVGGAGALFMGLGAGLLADCIGNPGARLSLAFVAPTVFFVSVSGAVRGYFQGCRNMVPTAVSQVIESLGKLILGLFFAAWAKKCGMTEEQISAMAILGLSVGTAIATAYLCIVKSRAKTVLECRVLDNTPDKFGKLAKRLVKLAIPVTVGSVLVSLTRIVDMMAIMGRLNSAEKISVYGIYSTMCLPIYNLPSSLVAGIALALVPSITNAVQASQVQREERIVASGIKLCALISLPASFGIGVYAKNVLELLFSGQTKEILVAAPLLTALSVSVFASCLLQVTNSVLQANGKIYHPIISLTCGMVVKCVSAYILIGLPDVGIMGAPVSTLLCNVTAVVVNLIFLDKYTAAKIELADILKKPTLCSAVSIVMSVLLFVLLSAVGLDTRIVFFSSVLLCASVYFVSVVLFGGLDSEEFEMLPVGNRLEAICNKINKGKKNNEQRRKNKTAFGKK